MSNSELTLKIMYERFIQIEEDLSLFELKIGKIPFWERIRFNVFQTVFYEKIVPLETGYESRVAPQPKLINYFVKAKNYLFSVVRLGKNPFLTRKKDLLFLSHPRRILQNGKWWDVYTDPLIDKLDYSTVSIEGDFSFQFLSPPKTKNLKYFALVDLIVELKRFFKIGKTKLNSDDKEILERIAAEFEKNFEIKLDLISLVINVLTKRSRLLPLYLSILKKIKPKIVIVICSYGKENFLEACKIKKIPVLELQHGVITRYHVGYSYEKKSEKKQTFPDYLLSFGEFWKKTVTYPIDKSKIFSVGYPEWERKKEELKNVKKKKQILFVSQKTIGFHLSKFASNLSKLRDLNYKIVYKLHPSECEDWRKNFPWLEESNMEVIDFDERDIYQLFAESEILIGVYSTAIFEGLSFGLRTFLYEAPGIEYMQQLLEEGIATKICNTEDFLEKIKKIKTKKLDSEQFFRRDSFENIKDKIDDIIKIKQNS